MSLPVEHPTLVPFDGRFRLADVPTQPPRREESRRRSKKRLEEAVDRLQDLQRMLYAHDHHAVLLVFQAMDAAGKDSTIRAVTTGVNPAGFQVYAFKAPSKEEIDHDFLWRTTLRLPEKGRIGIFEILVMDEIMRALMRGDVEAGAIRTHALAHGMRSLRLAGASKVAAGLTTIEEVVRVTQEA